MGKECRKCGKIKDLLEFYVNRARRDGRMTICGSCSRLAVKEYRKTPTGKANGIRTTRAYLRTTKGRAATSRANRAANIRDPSRRQACSSVSHAVAAGRMKRAADMPCSIRSDDCSGKHNWHHDSYREEDRLNVRVLCKFHHVLWHRNNTPKPYEPAQD